MAKSCKNAVIGFNDTPVIVCSNVDVASLFPNIGWLAVDHSEKLNVAV